MGEVKRWSCDGVDLPRACPMGPCVDYVAYAALEREHAAAQAELTRLRAVEARSDGAAQIAAERDRQMSAEGFMPAADLRYDNNELAKAAACYALPVCNLPWDNERGVPAYWPASWDVNWYKPAARNPAHDGWFNWRRRDLVRAGALIAAEIDRLTNQERQLAEACGRDG